jgi:signal transduction histidine kinase
MQILFSSALMLSNFKYIEGRRENAMRSIETSGKQRLIEELKAVLEQCVLLLLLLITLHRGWRASIDAHGAAPHYVHAGTNQNLGAAACCNSKVLTARSPDVHRRQSRFMSTVSHELRTPLNGIIGGLWCGVPWLHRVGDQQHTWR